MGRVGEAGFSLTRVSTWQPVLRHHDGIWTRLRATLDTVHEGPVTGTARPGQEPAAHLRVRRQDIEFQDVGPGRVEIAITVTNAGSSPSPGDVALIQSAPLGAFVAWRPLTILEVPALQPGESVVLRSDAVRATPKPLETPDRLPPARLLTALGFDGDEPRSPEARGNARISRALGLFRKFRPRRDEVRTDGFRSLQLPPSPFDLLTGGEHLLGGESQRIHRRSGGRAAPGHRPAHPPRAYQPGHVHGGRPRFLPVRSPRS